MGHVMGQCTIGNKADTTRMFSRSLIYVVFLLALADFQEVKWVRYAVDDVKNPLNLDKKAQNIHKSAYSSSLTECPPDCSNFPTVHWDTVVVTKWSPHSPPDK